MITSDVARRSFVAAICVAFALGSSPGRAETNEQRAISLFEKGRKLARDGRCAEAIAPLLESIRYAEGVGPLLNLGNCYEVLGKTASAHRWFTKAEQVAAARDDSKRRQEATQRAQALEKDLSMLVVHIPPALTSREAEVRLDGELLPRDRWGMPTPVDPGTHQIEVTAPPHPKQSGSVTVRAKGDRVEWTATSPPVESAASMRAPAAALAPVPEGPIDSLSSEPAQSSTQRTLGLVTGGVGLAGVAAGAVFGVISISAHSSVVGRCPSYPTCSSNDRDVLDEMNTRAASTGTASTISFVAGALLLAGGAALFLTAPSARAER
jgi:hypothetical protein